MLTHLVKVPLTLRPAVAADVASLMRLQANSGAAPQVIHPMIQGVLAQKTSGNICNFNECPSIVGQSNAQKDMQND